ncbi:hypothetical protein M9458_056773, partial [Cirrhinus mrigala]
TESRSDGHCSSLDPVQMVDQYLEMTSTALNVSGDHDNYMSPRDRSPANTTSTHPLAQDLCSI